MGMVKSWGNAHSGDNGVSGSYVARFRSFPVSFISVFEDVSAQRQVSPNTEGVGERLLTVVGLFVDTGASGLAYDLGMSSQIISSINLQV
jgi:hypothetical protein